MKNTGSVIKNPRITEKAAILAESSCYTFDVTASATKKEVSHAVQAQYKVTPLRIRTVNTPKKTVFRRGKMGITGGGRKAYVYLKKGDKIEVL